MVENSAMIMDKLQAKVENISNNEKLKYVMSLSKFESSYVLNLSGLNEFPQKIPLTGEMFSVDNTTFSVLDTGSQLNLNYANDSMLRKFLAYEGIPDKDVNKCVDSLNDWLDTDSFKRLNGAEKFYYNFEENKSYIPRNSNFLLDKAELKLLKCFGEYYDNISGKVNVNYIGGVNINTASQNILASVLGVPLETALQITKLRESGEDMNLSIFNINDYAMLDYASTFPTFLVEVYADTDINMASDITTTLIDFNVNDKSPFRIIKHVE